MLTTLRRLFTHASPATTSPGATSPLSPPMAQPSYAGVPVSHLQAAEAPPIGHQDELPAGPPPPAMVQMPNTGPLFDGEPVPAYPERPHAMPAVPEEVLIESQADLIDRLRRTLGYNETDYAKRLRPVLERYAGYVHLLPASESDHHCGRGGLFRHGLEVATYAAIQVNGYRFTDIDVDVETARHQKPRWILAATLAALLHDIAKPIVDIGATDIHGLLEWNPHAGSLMSWARRNKLTCYYVQWRPGLRYGRHDNSPLGLAVAREIIGGEILEWLGEYNGDPLIHQLFEAIYASGDSATQRNRINDIVRYADSESARLDMLNTRKYITDGTQNMAGRLAARILRVLQDVVREGACVNEPNARAFHTTMGSFGSSPGLIEAVVRKIIDDDLQGIPAQAARILDYLQQAGIIEECQVEGETFRTWRQVLTFDHNGGTIEATLQLIKFAQPHFLFGDMRPPAPIHARDIDVAPNPDAPDSAVETAEPTAAENPDQEPAQPQPQAPLAVAERKPESLTPPSAQQVATKPPGGDNTAPTVAAVRDRRQTMAGLERGAISAQGARPRTAEEAMEWFKEKGNPSEYVFAIIEAIRERRLRIGIEIKVEDERVFLLFPLALEGHGSSSAAVHVQLRVAGWVDEVGAENGLSQIKVRDVLVPAARLTEHASDAFIKLLPHVSTGGASKAPRPPRPAPTTPVQAPAAAPMTAPAPTAASPALPSAPAKPPQPEPAPAAVAAPTVVSEPTNGASTALAPENQANGKTPDPRDTAEAIAKEPPPPPIENDVANENFRRWAKEQFFIYLCAGPVESLANCKKDYLIAEVRAFSKARKVNPIPVANSLSESGPGNTPSLLKLEGPDGKFATARTLEVNPKYQAMVERLRAKEGAM